MNADTIIIADDHPLFRAAMEQAVLQAFPDCQIVHADSLKAMQDCLATHPDVDLVLMDLHMPGASGFSGLVYVNQHHPETPVVMVSANEDHAVIREAMHYGASGFIPKSADTQVIATAIREVLAGNHWLPGDIDAHQPDRDTEDLMRRVGTLTAQQFRVLTMIRDGMLNKQIAYDLNVSEATVKAHVTAIMRKLGVRTRTQAVLALGSADITDPSRR